MVQTRRHAGSDNATEAPVVGFREINPDEARRAIHLGETPRSPSMEQRDGNMPSTSQPRGEGGQLPHATTTTIPSTVNDQHRDVSPARSVASVRSTSSVTARIRQAQFEAEERLALLKKKELDLEAERIKRRLALDIELIQESEDTIKPGEINVEKWVQNTTAGAPPEASDHRGVPERGISFEDQQRPIHERRRTRSPTPSRSASKTRGIEQLVEALDKMNRSRAPPRQTYELPLFSGSNNEWFSFKAAMDETTRLYGFSPAENMARLRNCLRGEAKEAVSALLHTVNDPIIVMRTLEQCFGRPEVLIDRTINELRQLPKPGTSASELNTFAVKIQNIVSVLRAIDRKGYLFNPMLSRDILDKLSPHLRSRWCDYAEDHSDTADPEIVVLSRFLMKEADRALRYGYTTPGATSAAGRSQVSAMNKITVNKDNRKKPVYATDDQSEPKYRCVKCTGDHTLSKCPKFKDMNVEERWELVKKEGLCFKCIASRHRRTNCKSKSCGIDGCRHPHNPMLHSDRAPQATKEASSDAETVTATTAIATKEVMLKICPVTVTGPRGSKKIFALLDEGSTISLLDDEIARDIGAKGPNKPLNIRGVSMKKQDLASRHVKFTIQGANEQNHSMKARTVKNMELRSQTIPDQLLRLHHLMDLDESAVCYEQGRPQLLIGADNWDLIVSRELRLGKKNQPAASRTNLGWVIHGTLPRTMLRQGPDEVLHVFTGNSDRLESLVERHFQIDALGVSLKTKTNKTDQRAIEIFNRTAKRIDGHFEVGLPWKEDAPKLPPSYATAWRRLRNLEQKLDKSPRTKAEYEKQIQNLLQKGYAAPCDGTEQRSPKAWYLPHFAVTNPNKPGKVRLVFDAAAKSRGLSLNEFLIEGPDLLQSLQKILFRFRENKIGVTADIQEMFLQVKIRKEDQPAQMFLWRGSERDQPPREYKMTSMIFGASSSPFLAHSVRNKNAEEHENQYPEAARAIKEAHYMDDFVESYATEDSAATTIRQVDEIHQACGFKLRGWNSNSASIMNKIPEELRTQTRAQLLSGLQASEKTLGLQWDSVNDTLSFNTSLSRVSHQVKNLSRSPTKREALSAVMSLYDPLGLLSCYSITGKILLQRLWRENLSWDQTLPDEHAAPFMEWLGGMTRISELRLPRCYDPEEAAVTRQLHIFCDASESAFATAAYWRLEKADGTADVTLTAAKSKVAPLRTQTIPRLELQAAVIGVRLAATVRQEHRWTVDRVTYWTDSTTVLQWVKNETTKRHPPFVAHRLGEIAEASRPSQWRWVPTDHNVADLATRTGYIPANTDRWFSGPEFLKHRRDTWPEFRSPVDEPVEDEEVNYAEPTDEHSGLPDIRRFSQYERLIRATGLVLTFIDKCRKKTTQTEARHLLRAEQLWINKSQRDSFKDELELLRAGKTIPARSKIFKLDPVLSDDGLLRVNGRIGAAHVPAAVKRPIILDSRHPFTQLLIQNEHKAAGHANRERVVNDLRQRYWILRLRPAVRAAARKCAFCNVRRSMPRVPVTGDLPAARLSPFCRPFTNCGVDYFGPMTVAVGRRHEKRWGALFTCLSTRAVHLEIVHSLSTDSAVMALRRMAARRGWPAVIWSDNATNFRGADAELKAAYKEWEPALRDFGLTHRVSWRFIPPGAPNQGGAWERLVRSVKVALAAALNMKTPRDEVLQTLLIEAEHSINARPLTHVSVDPEDPEAITPNHFLLGSSAGLPTTGPCQLADRRTWRTSQALADEFWRRWVREYLPTLVPRQGSNRNVKNLEKGDLVVVIDPQLPRNTWPRGIVERVFPGPDNNVRCADVRTRSGIFRRPTSKLAVLRIGGSAEASPGGEMLGTASP